MRNVTFLLLALGGALYGQQLTIEQAVSEAIAHNLDYLARKYDLSIADAQVITAGLRPNPVLTLDADHLDLLGTGFNTQTNNGGPAEYSVRGDYLFERGHKRQARVALATGIRDVTRLSLVDAVRGLIQTVQDAYVDAIAAKDGLSLAQENLQIFQNIVSINELRLKDGDVARVELLRTEVAELDFANAVRQAELQVSSNKEKLRLLLGRPQLQAFEVTGGLRHDAPALDQPEILQRAFAQRPDLQALVRDERRAGADVRLQEANAKVDVQIGSEYRRQEITAHANMLGFFLTAQIPVFNRNQGEILRARQGQLQAQAQTRALRLTVENDVTLALLQYRAARDTLEKIEATMLAKARDVRSISEYSYKRGNISLLEFLDAVRAYNDTMQSYNDARAGYARSLDALDAATGGTTTGGRAPQP